MTVSSKAIVSVVIPAHNREQYVGRAIESVLSQGTAEIEIIVVDDASSDGTAEVATAIAHREARIRVLRHVQNRGAQAARNTGLHASTGEWVGFLDSDDYLLPDSLAQRLRAGFQDGHAVIHSECLIHEPGQPERRFGVPALSGRCYRQLLAQPGPVFPALLARREAWLSIGGLDERIRSFQEWDTAIRLARHYCFTFVEEPTFVYDRSPAETISTSTLRTAQGYEQVFRKHWLQILRHCGPSVLASHCRQAAAFYQQADRTHRAATMQWIARGLQPARTVLGAWNRVR